MTDNEIIKALECFAIDKDFDETHCIGCAFEHQFCTANMSEDIAIPALDLINRQKAEIERLKEENKKQKVIMEEITDLMFPLPFETDYDKAIKTAKSEAIKEFAERLEEKCKVITICNYGFIRNEINKVVKEMVGDV